MTSDAMNRFFVLYSILCVYLNVAVAVKELKIGFITDVHIGEHCNGDLSYEACKPVRALTDAVDKLNTLDLDGVFISGDLTSSALYEEYETFRSICDKLTVPWWPAIGNHDIWPYSKHDNTFNQTATPIGDQYFGDVFYDILSGQKWTEVSTSSWPSTTCLNTDFNYPSWFHNYVVTFPSFSDSFQFLVLDWNARETALPEPGVGPQAELHNFTCGTYNWLNTTLLQASQHIEQFFIVQHHPFHNRDALDPFGFNLKYNFTFDKQQDAAIQALLSAYYEPSAYIGSIAGHMHRWYNGTAFNKYTASDSSFLNLPAYETPACKGWWINEDFTSSIQIVTLIKEEGSVRVSTVDGYWKLPDGSWDKKPGVSNEIWGQ